MKTLKTFVIILLTGIILSGCKEKNAGVEVVPNLELIYLSAGQVDVPLKWEVKNDHQMKKDVMEAINSIKFHNLKSPIVYRLALRLFVNENGTIDKVKDIGSDFVDNDSSKNYDKLTEISKLDKSVAEKMTEWKFTPAIKNGKSVKSYLDLKVSFTDNPDGSYDINYGDFMTVYPSMNDFVPVDKMPQVITSIAPHYPELAKRAGIEGTAYVKVLLSTEGSPVKAVVIKTDNEIFNQPSIDAAMQFKFTSAERDNKPVAVWVVIPFRYRLDGPKGELMHYKDLKDMPRKK
ncbi:MAG: energy transducer TonB [Bacteroidetes bacterium]|nr:energy transducer TonB [Bacteroidota bacterium]